MDWTTLGDDVTSVAAAASWGDFETQIFALKADGQVWNRYWDGQSWHPWESLGGEFSGGPAASARGPDRIDVFAVGTDGVLRHRWWNGSEWVPWEDVEGAPSRAAAIDCSWVGDRLDLFVQSADGHLSYVALTA
jgi:hypothetical protein